MAKIKFTAFMADMRGKIAGTVFSKNRGGAIARTKVTPSNPQSAAQLVARSRLTGFSQAWRGLTQAARDAWDTAVQNFPRTNVFGDSTILSGHQLYIGLNSQLQAAGAATIGTPPNPSGAVALSEPVLTANLTGDIMSVAFEPGTVPADTAIIVDATTSLSPGRSNVKNQFRQIGVIDAAATSPADIWGDYIAKFGSPSEGQKVHVQLRAVNTLTGEVSGAVRASAIVANA